MYVYVYMCFIIVYREILCRDQETKIPSILYFSYLENLLAFHLWSAADSTGMWSVL